jgi:hypothetical protein
MDVLRPADTVSDQALDRDIGQALAVDPSPEFLPRVRAAIAEQATPSPWRFGWMLPAVTAAALTIVFVVTMWNRTVMPEAGPSVASVQATGSDIQLSAPPAVPTADTPRRDDSQPGRVVVVRRQVQQPEVLLSPSEAEGLRQLMAFIGKGAVDTSTLLKETASPAIPLEPVAEIGIPRLKIDPIVPAGH